MLNERFLIKPSCCTKSNALQKSNHPISTQVPSAARPTGHLNKELRTRTDPSCTNSTPLLSGSQKAPQLLPWALPSPWDFYTNIHSPPAPWKSPFGARGGGGHLAAGGCPRGVAEPGTDLLQSWAAEAGNQTSPQLPGLLEVHGCEEAEITPPPLPPPDILAGAAPGGIRARAVWAPCPPVPARGREKGADPESPMGWGDAPGPPAPRDGHCPSGRRLTSTFSSVPGDRMSPKRDKGMGAPSSTCPAGSPVPNLCSGTSKPQKLQLELASYQEGISPWQSGVFLGSGT